MKTSTPALPLAALAALLAAVALQTASCSSDPADGPDAGRLLRPDADELILPADAAAPAPSDAGADAGRPVPCTASSECPGEEGDCARRTCVDSVCGVELTAAGTPLAQQVAGDCRQLRCDGQGGAINAVDEADVEDDGNPCTRDLCSAGESAHPAEAPGTALPEQVAGDCHKVVCDGAGGAETAIDDGDLPVDGNPCTRDVCSAGTPGNPHVGAGASCGPSLACDGDGRCVGCLQAADCPGEDTDCRRRTCEGGVCGVEPTAAGTPLVQQTAGDCREVRCDGAGGTTAAADDLDLPADGKQCTEDVCTAGVPSHRDELPGTGCTEGGGRVCDGAGSCVGCVQAGECGTSTACRTFRCTGGACGSSSAPAGTVAANPTPGDCRSDQCDGAGNLVLHAVDDDDRPADDGSDCTAEVCTAGAPSHSPKEPGTPCGQGGVCDGFGGCVGCVVAADCGTDSACRNYTCSAGLCGTSDAAAGTVVANPTAGDCRSSQCDGQGNVAAGAVDDADRPADDGNACTTETCTDGSPDHPPAAPGATCSQNGGSRCDGEGHCVGCLAAADCGTDTACRTFTCTGGACGSSDAPAGTVVANPTPGDCRSGRCDDSGNLVANAVDDADRPADDGNACTTETCTDGTPDHPPAPLGATCSQNGGLWCDGGGACVECLVAADCGASTACRTFTCTGGSCGASNAAAGFMVANPTPGDCRSQRCDGAGNLVADAVDDSDLPADDGNQCTNESCVAGRPDHPPAAQGTSCNQNGGFACDGAGGCVQCQFDVDCPPAGSPCQRPTCLSGTCELSNVAPGPLPDPIPGDCHAERCDGSGAVQSVVDDSDLPADDGHPCTGESCTAGSVGHPALAAGTSCGGGAVCDGNGHCVSPLPAVVATSPADGASAEAATPVAVTFSTAMNPLTLSAQTSSGPCSGTIQVSTAESNFSHCVGFAAAVPTLSAGGTVATLTPRPGLLVNRTYKIRVTGGAAAADGTPLASAYASATGFGTVPPAAATLVISQVYGGAGSAGNTHRYDFVELHNRGARAVGLAGWSVQYGGATGTGAWSVAKLSGSIAAGGYYLVRVGNPAATGTDIPVADASTTAFSMATGAGKVALVSSETALSGACPGSAAIVDTVGYGATANCSERAAAPAPSASTAVLRAASGCVDSASNAADFATGTPAPRGSGSAAAACPSPVLNESNSALEADYCVTQHPLSLTVQEGTSTGIVYGQIYESGVTGKGSAQPQLKAQLGFGPATANPQYGAGWTWLDAVYGNAVGNNDEYLATFTAPAAGTYRFGYRFSLDGGASWTFCDNRQADYGAGSNPDLAFSLEDLAPLTVTP